jgi:hypothetical protein
MLAREDLPEAVARLLWDVDFARFDLDRDRQLVFERVMTRGTWEAMKWLLRRYSRADLAAFVRDYGRRVLTPRDLAYWALVCEAEVTGDRDGGGGRPRWAGT